MRVDFLVAKLLFEENHLDEGGKVPMLTHKTLRCSEEK